MTFLNYSGEVLHLTKSQYQNGTLAVFILDADGQHYATLSVNLPESVVLPSDHFFLKGWSENESIARAAIDSGLIEAANPFLYQPVQAGFARAAVYIVKGAAND